MPLDYTSSTFSEVYKDDYKDSAGYHKILFNSGRALQARELTQLQTILQEQIRRFADNIFLDGAAVGSSGTGLMCVAYVVIDDIPAGYTAKDYVGVTLQGPSTSASSGLQFLVIHAEESNDDDDATLFGVYKSNNQVAISEDTQESPPVFAEADTLRDLRVVSSLTGNPNLEVKTQPGSSTLPSAGRGLLFGVQQCHFWTNGHFVFAPEQLITLSKYDGAADVDVGFEVTKDIVTEEDDESLYDNQGVVPNLSSPGAHRFRIRLTLTTRSAVTNPDDFVYYASVRGGIITQVKGGAESYNQIEQRMALRQHETNGNFEVNPFEIRHLPGDSDDVLNLRVPGMNSHGVIPTAYIDGYRLAHHNDVNFLVHKPQSSSGETSQNINVSYKNFITVPYDSAGKTYLGNMPSGFELSKQTRLRLSDVTGDNIGTTRVKHIADMLGDPEGHRFYLYDTAMKDGYSFKQTHSITGEETVTVPCVNPPQITDTYATYDVDISVKYQGGTVANGNILCATPIGTIPTEINNAYLFYIQRPVEQEYMNKRSAQALAEIAAGRSEADVITGIWSEVLANYRAYEETLGPITDLLTFCDRNGDTSIIIEVEKEIETISTGKVPIEDPEISSSIHFIPGGRVKSISNVNLTTQREFFATASGNTIQITTGNNETFDDLSRWTIVNTTSGIREEVPVTAFNLNSTSPQTATVTVNGASDNYRIYAYVQKNAPTQKSKSFTKHVSPITASRVNDSGGDRFIFDLYDAISVTEVRADSANGRDIKDLVIFDNGQRDNYYAPVTLTSSGLPNDVTSVFAKFDYFTWGPSGDYFTVNSYITQDSFSYSDIPYFRSPRDGRYYDMKNHFDFRPKMNPQTDSMPEADRFENVRDGDNIVYDVEWYNKRIDHVTLGYNHNDFTTEIRVNEGPEAINPKPPSKKVSEMPLYEIEYNGNTFDIKDLIATKFNHKRFQMEDIAKLEDRIEDLEDTLSLSLLEQDVVHLVELNSSGEVRPKTGYFVDEFRHGFTKTSSAAEAFWIDDKLSQSQTLYHLPYSRNVVGPRSSQQAIQMLFDSDDRYTGRTPVSKIDVVRKGDLLYLDHIDVLDSSLANETISWSDDGNYEERGWFTINPFETFSGSGFLKLSPASDMWFDDHRNPNRSISTVSENVELTDEFPSRSSGTELDAFQTTVKSYVYSSPDVLGEDVAVYAIPYARQREIFGKAQGLKPNTRYWPFFDTIGVEQWVVAKTKNEYKSHLAADDHLKSIPEVDVNVLQHPDKSVASDSILITDANGDLFFSFWLPNNAPVPSPKGNSLNSEEEWEFWITNQRKVSKKYDGPLDPRVYDDIGWKFRTGSLEFLLNDISDTEISGCQSSAMTNYVSSGSLLITEKTVHMTRPVTKRRPVYSQPIAQTFSVSGRTGVPGAFITKIDVFLRDAPRTAARGGLDLSIPLQLQIREMENGTPVAYPAGEQYRIYKSADEIYDVVNNIANKEDIDDVLSNPVTFEFPEPVYLQANETYAVVLTSECNDYEVFVSTEDDLVLGKSDLRVSNKPAIGSLMLSQNGQNWSVKPDKNLAYRIYTAKFKSNGKFNMYNNKFEKYKHNTKLMNVDDRDQTRFRVNHYNHGLGVGDKIGLVGLDSSYTYLGVPALSIMDNTLTVDSADAAGYFVKLPSHTFSQTGIFGETTARSNRSFNYDRATYNVKSEEFPSTDIRYEGNMISGISHAKIDQTRTDDPRFSMTQNNTKFASNREMYFNTPKMLANPVQEMSDVGISTDSEPSTVFGVEFTSTALSSFGGPIAAQSAGLGYVSDVSPIIDLQRSMMVMENSIIDNQIGEGLVVDDYGIYDVNQTLIYEDKFKVEGSVLVKTPEVGAPTSLNDHYQSLIGRPAEQHGMNTWMATYETQIEAGVADSDAIADVKDRITQSYNAPAAEGIHGGVARIVGPIFEYSNIPQDFVPESNPLSGTSASKHITKPVTLRQSANGLRVFIDMFNPPAASFDLYYRTVSGLDEDIYSARFQKIESQNEPGDNQFNPDTFDLQKLPFNEYQFLVGGRDGELADFVKFQLKVVMRSTNSCEIPIMNSIRVAALI